MTFEADEISNSGGKPIMLFEFQRDATIWRYAAADRDVVVGANTYLESALLNGTITQSGDTTQDELTISAPLDLPLASAFANVPPSGSILVRVRRVHVGDADAPIVWVGTLDRVKATGDATAELVCRNSLSTLKRGGLRLAWTRGCGHMLYDNLCKVNRLSFRQTGTIVDVLNGSQIAVTAFNAFSPQMTGGYVEFTLPGGFTERRTIGLHNAETLTIVGGTSGMAIGMSIFGFFGCDRSSEVCETVFANGDNYGGFKHIPGKSPFDGTPVF